MDYDQNDDYLEEPIERIWEAMAYHRKYLSIFATTHDYILRGGGKLPLEQRHYIAMMAASRHRCGELVRYHRSEFKRNQGKHGESPYAQWHKGIRHTDYKMQNLDRLNRILAHQPWRVDTELMSELHGGPTIQDLWRSDDLVQAIVLLTHFHSMTSFAMGCAFMQSQCPEEVEEDEPSEENRTTISTEEQTISPKKEEPEISTNDELQNDDSLQNSGTNSSKNSGSKATTTEGTEVSPTPAEPAKEDKPEDAESQKKKKEIDDNWVVAAIKRKLEKLSAKREELEMAELARRFEKIEAAETTTIAGDTGSSSGGHWCGASSTAPPAAPLQPIVEEETDEDIVIYSKDHGFQYKDFVNRDEPKKFPTHKSYDFLWDDHGYPIVERYFGEYMSDVLCRKFNTIQNLTYMTIGDYTEVDTSKFRRAVVNYTHCLYGIRWDDYDYGEVNELLPRHLKKYIKTLACYPEKCTLEDYKSIMTDFKTSEKVHVCMLVCEAKLEASLVYALRAFHGFFVRQVGDDKARNRSNS